jgi:hypothetical protein
MDAVVPLLAAVLGAAVGTFGGYILGNRRLKYEKLYERRAEVIADLSEKLYALHIGISSFVSFASFGDLDDEERGEQHIAAYEAYIEFSRYFSQNEVWLAPDACDRVEQFLSEVKQPLDDYTEGLDERGVPLESETMFLGLEIARQTVLLRGELVTAFREILFPPPWYDAPLRLLEWLQARDRKEGSQE